MHLIEDGLFGRVTEAILYLRLKHLDILEMFKEQHQELPEVVQDSLARAEFYQMNSEAM